MTRSRLRRVLIVEDDVEALELIAGWTEHQGWEVRTASSGEEALDVGKSFKPHLLIVDYLLRGEVNGLDVIERLKREAPGLRCVLVTGLLGNALSEDVRRLHGVPILTKPFDFDRLRELLAS